MFIWRSLLRLPENHEAYAALVDKGTHPAYKHLHERFPIKSRKLLRVLQRLVETRSGGEMSEFHQNMTGNSEKVVASYLVQGEKSRTSPQARTQRRGEAFKNRIFFQMLVSVGSLVANIWRDRLPSDVGVSVRQTFPEQPVGLF